MKRVFQRCSASLRRRIFISQRHCFGLHDVLFSHLQSFRGAVEGTRSIKIYIHSKQILVLLYVQHLHDLALATSSEKGTNVEDLDLMPYPWGNDSKRQSWAIASMVWELNYTPNIQVTRALDSYCPSNESLENADDRPSQHRYKDSCWKTHNRVGRRRTTSRWWVLDIRWGELVNHRPVQ